MRIAIILMCLAVGYSATASAEVLGLRAEGGIWKYSTSGSLRDSAVTTDAVDLKSDLNIKDASQTQYFVYLRHPVPVIPNIRVGHTSMPLKGTGVITQTVNYGGTSFTASDTVITDADLSHTDLGIYYNLWDTFVTFDLGINAKVFDTKATITDVTNPGTGTATIKGTVPMLYAAIAIPFPGTGFDIAGDLSAISAGSDKISDLYVRLRYQIISSVGIEAGYRAFELKYEDGNTYADVKTKGSFINLFLHF